MYAPSGKEGVESKKCQWSIVAVGVAAFGLAAWLGSDYNASSWWYVPAYVGLTTAVCATFAALRFPRRAATWAVIAGGVTGIAGLFWGFLLWVFGAEAADGYAYVALLVISLAVGASGLTVVRAVARRQRHVVAAAEAITLALVLAAAGLEAFAYEDGDGNLVGLTLIPAVMLGFARWRLRAEPG
jgi:hypothetical protein